MHSYGAYLALVLAMRDLHRVASLVLAEPPVIPLFTSFPPKPNEMLRLLVSRPATAVPIIRFAAAGLAPATSAAKKGDMEAAMRHFGAAVLGKSVFDALPPTRLEQVRANLSEAELLSESFMTPLDPGDVVRVDVPTLLVTGERSPAMFTRLVERLQELLPRAERVEIPHASHIMHEDNATAFNTAVRAFLLKQHEQTQI